ncbi:MAG: hypothetical protein ABL962_02260, partial [Fimbriimonadaceae bacterium]
GDQSARWFIGRRKGSGTIRVETKEGKKRIAKTSAPIKASERGPDTAKLWAHQKLARQEVGNPKDILAFSMKYQVPSSQTALLAVPQEQMKLFKEKAAEFRRKQAEEARRARNWQKERQQNWRSTGGGDPEIRIQLEGAVKAVAILPDGREIALRATSDGFWGGSYDIPALATEGDYAIRIVATRADGSTFETKTSYNVDRTAPEGTAIIENGSLIVKSEAKLARVVAVMVTGAEIDMKEEEPGVYRLKLESRRVLKVVLIDDAHNMREVQLSRR